MFKIKLIDEERTVVEGILKHLIQVIEDQGFDEEYSEDIIEHCRPILGNLHKKELVLTYNEILFLEAHTKDVMIHTGSIQSKILIAKRKG